MLSTTDDMEHVVIAVFLSFHRYCLVFPLKKLEPLLDCMVSGFLYLGMTSHKSALSTPAVSVFLVEKSSTHPEGWSTLTSRYLNLLTGSVST